jgi:zinc protease
LLYAFQPNSEPLNKASLRLFIRSGSLHEEDEEQGLAHLLEHMAFVDSWHFPSRSLVSVLQEAGIGFGLSSSLLSFSPVSL